MTVPDPKDQMFKEPVCPECGGELIEDDVGLACLNCGWQEESEDVEEPTP